VPRPLGSAGATKVTVRVSTTRASVMTTPPATMTVSAEKFLPTIVTVRPPRIETRSGVTFSISGSPYTTSCAARLRSATTSRPLCEIAMPRGAVKVASCAASTTVPVDSRVLTRLELASVT